MDEPTTGAISEPPHVSQSALVLTDPEWYALERIARAYRDNYGTEWAETDEDEEAYEVRSARVLCTRLIDAAGGGAR